MEHRLKTDAELLLEQAFAGKLDMNATGVDAPGAVDQPGDEDDTGTDGSNKDGNQQSTTATPPAGDAAAAALEEQQAPIASKSGAYTIPYTKLVEAREKATTLEVKSNTLEAENATLKQTLADLQAQADARQAAGAAPTQQDNTLAAVQAALDAGVDPDTFGDFGEKDMAKGVMVLAAKMATKIVDEKLAEALKPYQQQAVLTEEQRYYAPILAKHPDAVELMESAEFKAWEAGQPAFARAGIQQTLDKGTNVEVIAVFDAFKDAQKQAAGAPGKPADPAALARAAVEGAVTPPPISISDLPGSAGMTDTEHAMATSNDPQKLMEMMMNMTPEKRMRIMDRAV